MRDFLVGLVAVGLLIAPAFGDPTISVELRVNGVAGPATLAVGQIAAVEGWFKCDGAGIVAIGGDVVATGTTGVLSVTGTPLSASTFFASGLYGGAPVAGANGSVGQIACMKDIFLPPGMDTTFGNGTFVKLFSYTVKADGNGTVALNWQEAPAGGYGGFYTTDTAMNNGIASSTGVTITTVVNRNLISSSVDNAVAGKKTLWRTKKNIVRLTFDQPLTDAPTAGQIKVFQCFPAGVEGPDLSSNFLFTLESGGTVVRCLDNSPNGVLANRTWYAIRLGTLPNTNAFTKLIPVMVGDTDGNGVLSSGADVNPIVVKATSGSPSVAPNDADRRDVDGNMIITVAGDVNAPIVWLSSPTLPPKPTGY